MRVCRSVLRVLPRSTPITGSTLVLPILESTCIQMSVLPRGVCNMMIHPAYLAFFTSQGHTQGDPPLTLFGNDGPRPMDVAEVVTDSGWFEIPVMALVTTSPQIFSTMLTDVNSTYVDVRWIGPYATTNSSSVTVTVQKRAWSSQSAYVWPAAIYDAYLSLEPIQETNSVPKSTYSYGEGIAINATQLFVALTGHNLTMTPCPSNITDPPFLVWQNTAAGPTIEAAMQFYTANTTVQILRKQEDSIVTTQFNMSDWLPQCISAFIPTL